MEVNLSKSEIMVFRKGGRLSDSEKWTLHGEEIRIVPEYCYLGVLLTSRMNFSMHIEKRNFAARTSIIITWKNFLSKRNLTLGAKWKLFQAVGRAIQTYGAQVWGFKFFEEVDKLQRYFLKRILRIPSFTPNYALFLETGIEASHLYSLDIHLRYITKILFKYGNHRLPHKLALKILDKKLFWADELNNLGREFDIEWTAENLSEIIWKANRLSLLSKMKEKQKSTYQRNARESETRIYRDLDYTRGANYICETYDQSKITWIFKARCELLYLNGNRFDENQSKICSLCNLGEIENVKHFVGRCPILKEFRIRYFGRQSLLDFELINILNGNNDNDWANLYNYIVKAMHYREHLISEFNF